MGLDIFDGLSALGAGMSKYGEIKLEDKKRKLAEKLELEREARAEARDERRFKREQQARDAEVQNIDMIQKDGVWMERGINRRGDPLFERLAPANKIEQANYEREFRDAKLTETVLSGKAKQAELDYLPRMMEADLSLKTTGAAENLAQRTAALASAERARRGDEPKPPSPDESRKIQEQSILNEARARIGKRKKDGTTVTVEEIAARLRSQGYAKLAKELTGSDDDTE